MIKSGTGEMIGKSQVMRRVGLSPAERGCDSAATCPDVLELASGDWAIIGTESTATLRGGLPGDAGCGDHESIVVIPRDVLLAACRQLIVESTVSL